MRFPKSFPAEQGKGSSRGEGSREDLVPDPDTTTRSENDSFLHSFPPRGTLAIDPDSLLDPVGKNNPWERPRALPRAQSPG